MSTPLTSAELGAVRQRGALAGLLFALVWLSCAWFGSWEWNPNNATRMFAALSMVEQGDATIDEYQALTVDKAKFGPHYYLDKAPGMTLMALPAVAFGHAATGQSAHDMPIEQYNYAFERFLRWRLRLATATTAALLTAIAAVAMLDLGLALGGSLGAGLFAALAFALGTPVWGWSTTLFGHAPVAALLVIAVWAVFTGTRLGEPPSRRKAALAGLALGWAAVIEYGAVIPGVLVAAWALWRWRVWQGRWSAALVAAACGVAMLCVLLGYNLYAFGTPFRLGYQGVVGFEGMNRGLFGLTSPDWEVLGKILGGNRRGLVWVAPVLVLGVAGWGLLLWRRHTRSIALLAVAATAAVLLYNASYAYWDGGNSTGPRHAVPAIPFIALGLAPLWAAARRWWARAAMLALLAVSMAINTAIASAEITSGAPGEWPLWHDVIAGRFAAGYLRTIPNEWWGWSAWGGLALWAAFSAAIGVVIGWVLLRDWRAVRPA